MLIPQKVTPAHKATRNSLTHDCDLLYQPTPGLKCKFNTNLWAGLWKT
jgi:hypothetical protein